MDLVGSCKSTFSVTTITVSKWTTRHLCVCVCVLTVSIHLVDHVLQLCLCRILAQRPHDGAELFGGDCAITVLVE